MSEAHSAVASRTPVRSLAELGVLGVALAVWFVLLRNFGSGDVYAVMGPYACALCVLCLALRPRAVRSWLAPHWKPVAIGLGVGVAMTLVTYPVFRVAVALFSGLESEVATLYQGARSTTPAAALAWIAALALAEELLFRGVLPDALQTFVSERAALGVSLVCYALAQLGTGSLIVPLMAAACGTLWTVQRVLTRSLLSPLIAHLIWSPTVILLHPVTQH